MRCLLEAGFLWQGYSLGILIGVRNGAKKKRERCRELNADMDEPRRGWRGCESGVQENLMANVNQGSVAIGAYLRNARRLNLYETSLKATVYGSQQLPEPRQVRSPRIMTDMPS
ncbi:unnamed protein product [Cyclocybe aegerita]|uniref:Uncharacterized protein n=1 Tax=Cyclocybe aegerita TaxID=1973307 RepID=A0A8S0VQ34_CYCAE|nr:unnamed protein product [Cyclocybe aegerita]